ncbi:MAG: trypsin-like peptidase domain-containing protein [Chloroflexota bacterium]|nr:trypsin-like peptidase domain-containing protein [Chloroflexota bacterium]
MTAELSVLSEELADTVASVGMGVVRVEGRGRLPASGVVWTQDGVIVTANHVLERDDDIRIGLSNGESAGAALIGRDPTTDLAALRLEVDGLNPPGLSEPEGIRVGNIALALGRPGRTVQATLGIVSALGECWRTPAGGRISRWLQTDLVMLPGFSGGPLVDASGSVIGMNTSALLRGVNVAVPIPTIRAVVEELLAYGRIRRGHLGVSFQLVRLPEGVQLDQETGLLVASVEKGSAAEQGGLLLGDTLAAVNGEAVRHPDDLMRLLGSDSVGTNASLLILRAGEVRELSLIIGERR